MPCTPLTTESGTVVAIVCGPGSDAPKRRFYSDCPTCKRRRRFVARFDGLYYGETQMCCGCGDAWQDGYRLGRPARKGWRKDETARAQKWWAEAMTPRQYDAALRAEMDRHMEFVNSYDDESEGDA